jgi:hypothetical protein
MKYVLNEKEYDKLCNDGNKYDEGFNDMWNMIKNIKLPVWNLCFAGFAMYMGAIAEKLTNNNFIFEEGFELLFYVSLLGIVWLYSRNKNFILEEEKN